MKQTAVEWYSNKLLEILGESVNNFTTEQTMANHYVLKQAKEMEQQRMIDLVQQLIDYTRESRNLLGFDEKEASEFVELFTKETFNK
jgi:hypothetical protein